MVQIKQIKMIGLRQCEQKAELDFFFTLNAFKKVRFSNEI